MPTSSAGLVVTALMGDGVATDQAGGDGAAGLSKDSQVLMNFLTKLDAKFDAKFADFDAKINSGFLTLEQKLSDDLGATEQRIESRLHAKTVSMVSDLRSGLTADSNTGFSKLEQAIKVLMTGLHRWLLIIISWCQMFQSCRICFRLKSNHEVRMSVTERRFLPAVRQCLVVSLRLCLA